MLANICDKIKVIHGPKLENGLSLAHYRDPKGLNGPTRRFRYLSHKVGSTDSSLSGGFSTKNPSLSRDLKLQSKLFIYRAK